MGEEDRIPRDVPVAELVNAALKIEAHEAGLFGLDAPARQEVSGPDGAPLSIMSGVDPKDMEERLNRLTAREQALFIDLLAKMDGVGNLGDLAEPESVETTAVPVDGTADVPAVAPGGRPG